MRDCPPRREVLARGPMCHVERCVCGTVHLTIGALTLRLDPHAIASIWGTVGEALEELGARGEATSPPRARGEVMPS